jgi:hypothetical protein
VIIIILAVHAVGLFAVRDVDAGSDAGRGPVPRRAGRALRVAGRVAVARPAHAAPCLATMGAMLSSALLVELSGGLIEAHFHFFVMLSLITVYQDWLTFLLAAAFVVVEHAVVGVICAAPGLQPLGRMAPPGAVRADPRAVRHRRRLAADRELAAHRERPGRRAAVRRPAHYEAGHDALTGALNRREFDRRSPSPRAGRYGRAVLPRPRPLQDRQRQLRARRRRPAAVQITD